MIKEIQLALTLQRKFAKVEIFFLPRFHFLPVDRDHFITELWSFQEICLLEEILMDILNKESLDRAVLMNFVGPNGNAEFYIPL
jgi:hypothetical protein